jgi:choline dehydrogenase-like flavoprotein
VAAVPEDPLRDVDLELLRAVLNAVVPGGDDHPSATAAGGPGFLRRVLTQDRPEWIDRPRRALAVAHQAGTCRMGDDPASSVVDPEGRLWGHHNVRIVDGSVHVTNGGVNPVLTILANAYGPATSSTSKPWLSDR